MIIKTIKSWKPSLLVLIVICGLLSSGVDIVSDYFQKSPLLKLQRLLRQIFGQKRGKKMRLKYCGI